MKNQSIVLDRAKKDYNPLIVKINEKNLDNLNIYNLYLENLAPNETNALNNKSLELSIAFILRLNSINFKYWTLENGQFIRYHHEGLIGALAAHKGFFRLDNYLKENNTLINIEAISNFFGNISEKEERLLLLTEVYQEDKMDEAISLIKSSLKNNMIDVNLANDIAQIFPLSFKEPYLKKIQLALYEIALHARSFNIQTNIFLTVAADYQLPKVLEAMGILSYSNKLSNKINNYILLDKHSIEENAIRAATVIACEKISTKYNVSIPTIDRWLWLARNDFKNKKFHLTNTTDY